MKYFDNKSKGLIFQIIGYIIFSLCWLIPVIIDLIFSDRNNLGLIFLITQIGIGGFLILFGGAVNKREDEDPNYEIPKNFLKVFRAWQILLMCAFISFFVMVFGNLDRERERLESISLTIMYICLIASAVVGIIQYSRKDKKKSTTDTNRNATANRRVKQMARCHNCGSLVNPDTYARIDGIAYCPSCYINAMAQIEKERKELFHTKCAACGGDFPKSTLHHVGERYICENCFQKEFRIPDF